MTKRIKEWFKKIDWISTKVSAHELNNFRRSSNSKYEDVCM
jgi:hypothetical protein